jgi:hypothetical protein
VRLVPPGSEIKLLGKVMVLACILRVLVVQSLVSGLDVAHSQVFHDFPHSLHNSSEPTLE